MSAKFAGPPMDLANMRSLGVTPIMAYCSCRREAAIDVSALPVSGRGQDGAMGASSDP
jgi:hypothetical protein